MVSKASRGANVKWRLAQRVARIQLCTRTEEHEGHVNIAMASSVVHWSIGVKGDKWKVWIELLRQAFVDSLQADGSTGALFNELAKHLFILNPRRAVPVLLQEVGLLLLKRIDGILQNLDPLGLRLHHFNLIAFLVRESKFILLQTNHLENPWHETGGLTLRVVSTSEMTGV